MAKKRTDAHYCYDIPEYNRIFPYMWKRRCDCQVFHEMTFDVTSMVAFIKKWNKEHTSEPKLHLTSMLLAVFARVIALRPGVNRFVAGKEFWQRDEVSMTFVVKKDMSDASNETSEPIKFDPLGSLLDHNKIIEDYITRCTSATTPADIASEALIGKLYRMVPKWILGAFFDHYAKKDHKKGCPAWVRDADGLHSSIFVANLASLGVKCSAPHHHLYEWGTTSMFCIIGPLNRTKVATEGKGSSVSLRDSITCSFTVDERICDGLYFLRTLELIQKILSNPESAMNRLTSEELPHLTTKEEYLQKQKEIKAQIKAAKRSAKGTASK